MTRWTRILLMVFIGSTLLMAQDAPEPSAQHASPSTPAPKESRERLLSLVPTPLPAAATAQEAAAFYLPDTLYQYMDGAADVYVLYDFQVLLHQEFRAKEAEITVDVFDMGLPENAFGIYAAERSPDYQFIAIGAEGYKNQGILNFLQGRYYIKLAGFGAGADAVLDQFARGLSAKIGGPAEFPPMLQQLPLANRKPHSEQYLLKDPLGHSFLGPAYVAHYDLGPQESTLLVSVAPTAAQAQERLARLAEHFRKTGKCASAPELGEGAVRASNSFEGATIARVKGRYLVVLFSPAPGADALFKDALQRLP